MCSQNGQGPRPIHWASRNGHAAVVDILLGAGVPVDATDNKGLTPVSRGSNPVSGNPYPL